MASHNTKSVQPRLGLCPLRLTPYVCPNHHRLGSLVPAQCTRPAHLPLAPFHLNLKRDCHSFLLLPLDPPASLISLLNAIQLMTPSLSLLLQLRSHLTDMILALAPPHRLKA